MVDVAEVVVRATPEGLQNTTDQVDEMSDGVEDSTDEMDEQADVMSRLSKRFSGAMGAVMTGLAVATAGLLSQVPVIGELMGGLGAIIDALAFRLDSLLRPTFGPIVDRMFDFADVIFEADGALGMFIDILLLAGLALVGLAGVVLGVTKVLLPMIKALVAFGSAVKGLVVSIGALLGGKAALIAAGKALVTAIVGIVSAIGLVPLAIAAAVVGLGLLIWHFREGIVNAIGVGVDAFTDFVRGLGDMISDGMSRITDFVSDISDAFTDLASDAFGWGVSLVQGLLGGILSLAETVVEAFQAVINSIIGTINTALDVLPDEVTSRVGVDQFDEVDFSSDLGRGSPGDGGGFIGGVGGGGGATFLDGRRVDSNQGRFRKDSLTRRGG